MTSNHWFQETLSTASKRFLDRDSSFLLPAFALGAGIGILGFGFYLRAKPADYYGPGPRGIPILGNARQLPKEEDFKVYMEWAKKYGELIYLNVLGQPIYILGSFRVAFELMDKRSTIYSDRPYTVMASELVGWGRTPVLASSQDPHFRRYRKLFHTALNKTRVGEMTPVQEQSNYNMLLLFLEKPDDFQRHIRYCVGSVITRITYAYNMKLENDPFVGLAEKAADTFSQAASPGAWLVDLFPFLKHVPAWFPGASFKRLAIEWRAIRDELHSKPYNEVKRQIAEGTAPDSITQRLLTTKDETELNEEEDDLIMWLVGSIYTGGADTSVCALHTFVLAMILYPDVQRLAQEEIDRVIGTDRLPCMADRASLPYVQALFLEVLRWHPIAPLGFPHRLTKDDHWEGYFLPAGSIVIANIWAMAHEEEDSYLFKPERFLKDDFTDPRDYVFGFGRRLCPGRELADSGVWLGIVCLLAAFRFGKKPDGKGGLIPVEEAYFSGIICHPKPFECSITPRYSHTASLIRSTVARDAEM